jgi:serine/threonine-protein kinase
LDEACRGDAALRAEVERRLADDDRMGRLLGAAHDSRGGPGAHEVTVTPGPAQTEVLADVVPGALLRDPDPGPTVREQSPEISGPVGLPGKYQLFGEIGHGGMGVVLKARDPDLGRDLALKVLLDRHRDRPEMVRRFVEEAQIGGQLQHPGIVPVYELGTFTDRRPFFTMKLVKGRTLAAMLEGRGDPADDLPRFLGVFEQVCQTVAYAHSRGVIHRDLKPSNVMVGAFGEVQVMDWGLAKVMTRKDPAEADDDARGQAETVTVTARSGADAERSVAGVALGTPAYMAPEQAWGEVHLVDERVDVFALGSILCEVLTGQPAFTGRSPGEVLRKSERADLSDALSRLDACEAEPGLIALARGCLQAGPEDRPRDAGVVAGQVTAYLAGVQERLRAAELARVAAQARAEEEAKRRALSDLLAAEAQARAAAEAWRRRVTVALAASVLALGVMGGGGMTYYAQQRAARLARLDGLLRETATALERAEHADETNWLAEREKARIALGQAEEVAAGRTDAARAATLRTLRDRTAQVDKTRRLLVELEAIRGSRAEHLDRKRTDADYAAAFRQAGLDLDAVGPAEVGRWFAGRSGAVELALYLDDWALVRQAAGAPEATCQRLVDAARAADPDPWRNDLRSKMVSKNAEVAESLRALADDENALETQSAVSLVLLARRLKEGANDRERAERVLEWAWARFPGDFWVNLELAGAPGVGYTGFGDARTIFPHPAEALRYLTAAVAIRPRSAMAHNNLAVALTAQGNHYEAIAAYREAIRLKPDFASAHMNLGNVLYEHGKLDEAVAELREAVRLDPGHAMIQYSLGIVLQAQEKLDGAVTIIGEALHPRPNGSDPITSLPTFQAPNRTGEALHPRPNYTAPPTLPPITLPSQALNLKVLRPETSERVRHLIERGQSYARRLGQWDRAAEDYALVLELDPGPYNRWHQSAALQLQAGFLARYHQHCRTLLRRFGETQEVSVAERVAKTCLLAPERLDDLTLPMQLAERCYRLSPNDEWVLLVKGLADYRARSYEAAVDEIDRGIKESKDLYCRALSILVQSMASARLGRADQARRSFQQASRIMTETFPKEGRDDLGSRWLDWLHCRIIHREAEAVMMDLAFPADPFAPPKQAGEP